MCRAPLMNNVSWSIYINKLIFEIRRIISVDDYKRHMMNLMFIGFEMNCFVLCPIKI